MELGPEDVSLLERCPHFRGCYVQATMELGPEDVSLLEKCSHFRECYVQATMELGPEDVSLLERCPLFAVFTGEKNLSLRKNIVDRVLRIYHATCRNLTVVNDNLSRNQATIEVKTHNTVASC